MPTVIGKKDGSHSAGYRIEKQDKIEIVMKSWSDVWYVLADTVDQDDDLILMASGLPTLYDISNGAYCKNKKAKAVTRVRHPVTGAATELWEVAIDFDNDIDPDQGDEDDPTNKPATIRWHGETEDELLEKDPITGEAIETDAGEPILMTSPFVMPVLEIKRYESYPFNPNTMLNYSHRINSTAFWGAAEGTALMLPMEVDQETIEGVIYAVVTYRIKFKIKEGQDEPWKAHLLHHGFKYRPEAGGKPEIFKDKHGNPATVNLKTEADNPGEGGTLLPDGDPAEYKEFNRFTKANFNTLSLGPF